MLLRFGEAGLSRQEGRALLIAMASAQAAGGVRVYGLAFRHCMS